ncbi:MAG: DNA-formamidopyrimidine glycosylase family protein [Actinomycetota bacterium]
MPELPEMQALAERLDALLRGKELTGFHLHQFSALKTYDPAPEAVIGLGIEEVRRRGKYLVFDLEDVRLLVHLSQGGRVALEDPPRTSRPKHAVARLGFQDAPSLLIKEFGTQRKAGLWLLAGDDEGPLERLGPEPDDPSFREWVSSADDGRRLHTSLRDQRTVAGIGRGFVDDILHEAGLSPYATLRSLDPDQRSVLLEAVATVLARGLQAERRRTGGLPDKLPGRFAVHGRFGSPCPRCGEALQRVSYEDYEIVYCPACQTGGKRLADRRLSRLVK